MTVVNSVLSFSIQKFLFCLHAEKEEMHSTIMCGVISVAYPDLDCSVQFGTKY